MKKTGGLVAHTSNDNIGLLLQGPTFVMLITVCKSLQGFFLIVHGSQRSYISETNRSKLKLKTVGTERAIINTFGRTEGSEVPKLDIVQFRVKHRTDYP